MSKYSDENYPDGVSTEVEVPFRVGDQVTNEKITLHMPDVGLYLAVTEEINKLETKTPKKYLLNANDTEEKRAEKIKLAKPYVAAKNKWDSEYIRMFTKGKFSLSWFSDVCFIAALLVKIQVFTREITEKEAAKQLDDLAIASEKVAKEREALVEKMRQAQKEEHAKLLNNDENEDAPTENPS